MKTILRAALQLGLIGALFGVAYSLVVAPQPAQIIVAATTGFVITAALGGLIQAIPIATRRRPDLPADETILRESLAVSGDPFNDAGGWLFLTNKNLRFKSHGMSSRKRELKLPLNEVAGFATEDTKRSSDKTLQVRMLDGRIERFSLESAQSWQKQIGEHINGANH